MAAFFDRHPDAMAWYDLTGRIVRINAAQATLSELSREAAVGRHFLEFVTESSRAAMSNAFERAAAGESIALETQFPRPGRDAIDVQSDLFGDSLDGATTGVIVVSKSIVALKQEQAQNAAHAQRMALLYAIACGHGRSSKQQMDDALQLATAQLDYDWGGVSEIVDDTIVILSMVGTACSDATGVVVPGTQIPLKDSLSEFIVRGADVWEENDLAQSGWRDYPGVSSMGLGSAVAMPIVVGASIYGTYVLASTRPRTTSLSEADRNFLRLVATLLGSMIERKRHEQKLDSLAFFDVLTGLPNRVSIARTLEQSIATADRQGATFFVLYLDLDRFKDVNDRGGHAIGDRILRLCAQRMQQCLRATDIVGRFGGDEFVVIQAATNGRDGAVALADRLIAALAQPFVVENAAYTLGLSVGISAYPGDGPDSATLLASADKAMYRAKHEARSSEATVVRGTLSASTHDLLT